jgi:hypothetical protein
VKSKWRSKENPMKSKWKINRRHVISKASSLIDISGAQRAILKMCSYANFSQSGNISDVMMVLFKKKKKMMLQEWHIICE